MDYIVANHRSHLSNSAEFAEKPFRAILLAEPFPEADGSINGIDDMSARYSLLSLPERIPNDRSGRGLDRRPTKPSGRFLIGNQPFASSLLQSKLVVQIVIGDYSLGRGF